MQELVHQCTVYANKCRQTLRNTLCILQRCQESLKHIIRCTKKRPGVLWGSYKDTLRNLKVLFLSLMSPLLLITQQVCDQ